nr:G2/mitotic-specific cyclin-B3-like [Drosophila kikkawai]
MASNKNTCSTNENENPTGSKRKANPETQAKGNNKRLALDNITNGLNPGQKQEENPINAEEQAVSLELVTLQPYQGAPGDIPFLPGLELIIPISPLPPTLPHACLINDPLNNEDSMQSWPYALGVAIANIAPEANAVPAGEIDLMPEAEPYTVRASAVEGESNSPFIDVVNIEQEQQQRQVVPPKPRRVTLMTVNEELNNEDPMQKWEYAMEVFIYLKEREKRFIVRDYMPRQTELTAWKRMLLINWMVTVHQEYGTFRETHFLSVKIVDLYLSSCLVAENMLQLLGAAAINIAAKFEENDALPAQVLLQMCQTNYSGADLNQMEWLTLSGIGFDLGIPIGYRFLRRYARSSGVPEPTWTLGSYILELGIFDYTTVGHSDSQLAAAALFMALRMHGNPDQLDGDTWNESLVYYSGYQLAEFARLVVVLNDVLHRGDWITFGAVRNLYSMAVLHKVAMVPLLTNEVLFSHNQDLYNPNES